MVLFDYSLDWCNYVTINHKIYLKKSNYLEVPTRLVSFFEFSVNRPKNLFFFILKSDWHYTSNSVFSLTIFFFANFDSFYISKMIKNKVVMLLNN